MWSFISLLSFFFINKKVIIIIIIIINPTFVSSCVHFRSCFRRGRQLEG